MKPLFDDKQLAKLALETPQEALEAYTTLDGTELTGVKWTYFNPLLNEVLGQGNWTVKIYHDYSKIEKCGNKTTASVFVQCSVIQYVENESYPRTLWIMDNVGSACFDRESAPGDLLKAATTDGIKKCFSMLGFCWDVYSGKTRKNKKVDHNIPRTDKSSIKDEDREEANAVVVVISNAVMKAVEKLNLYKGKLTKEQKKIKKMQAKNIFPLATEALHTAILEQDDSINMLINESIYDWSDFHTINELNIARDFIVAYLDMHTKDI